MKEIEKHLTKLTSSDFWNKKDTKVPLSRTKIQTIVNNYLKKHNINIGTSTCFTYINNKNVVNLDLYPFKNSYISIYFEIKLDCFPITKKGTPFLKSSLEKGEFPI